MATQLLAEYCPRCSKNAMRDVERVPVDASVENFPRNVVFLEHGACPRCGGRRSEFVRKGSLNLYEEMDLVLGQRSGKALALNTMLPTPDG